MKQKLGVFPNTKSSVDILREYIEDISVKNLNNDWIQEKKIDLNLLMEDTHSYAGFKVSSRHFCDNRY
ncbi:hypothetical protein [Methanolobus vulcani]|uniref:Uncharacterized protein n=1 Tax=Methanolobus vulcani TaxID=38026 RepID=A0A7Z8KQ77_9EURY|nr:hypothetical protein [Methanolobus vulcani]TQD26231.1 hypothetical protein FKV42_05625 [Methanolobus vulcani]